MASEISKMIGQRIIRHAIGATLRSAKNIGKTSVSQSKGKKVKDTYHNKHAGKPLGPAQEEKEALKDKIRAKFGMGRARVGGEHTGSVIAKEIRQPRARPDSSRNPANYETPADPNTHPARALRDIPSPSRKMKNKTPTYTGGMSRKQRVEEQRAGAAEQFNKPLGERAAAAAAERHHAQAATHIGGSTSRTITMPEAQSSFKRFQEARRKLGGHAPTTTTSSPGVKLHLGPAMARTNRLKKKSWGVIEFMKSKKKKNKNKPWKSDKGKEKIHKVMHEYKHGELHSGSKEGPQVAKRKQAVAIALSEAREATHKSENAHEKVDCVHCGQKVRPGLMHYPGGDPENGPAHMPIGKKEFLKTPEGKRSQFHLIHGGKKKSYMGIVEFIKSKKSMALGGGGRFEKLAKKAGGGKKGAAIAAAAGQKKYGKKKMAKMAAKGRKRAMKKSWNNVWGILDFMKGRRKIKTLKAGRVRRARVSSGTYRQTAPAVKRSTRAKLRNPLRGHKRNIYHPKNKGMTFKSYVEDLDKSKKKKKKHRIDVYRPHTKFDREMIRKDGDQENPFDECEGLTHSPHEPERARGLYEKRKYDIQREA